MGQVSTIEAARIHGVTPQTIRRWIASGRLRGVRDNHGNILVDLDVAREATLATSSATPVDPSLGDLVADLRQRLDKQEARHDAEMARRLAERDTLHLGHIDRLLAQVAAERALWLERVDAAEIRAERVEQRLDQVLDELLADRRRSFWQRWFGR
jgi:hypothetical protein